MRIYAPIIPYMGIKKAEIRKNVKTLSPRQTETKRVLRRCALRRVVARAASPSILMEEILRAQIGSF